MKTSKRVISLLLSLMLVLGTVAVGGVTASADYHVVDGIRWIYEVLEDGKSVRIAYGTEPADSSLGELSGLITIPDRFQLDDREYTVKEIGDGAFNSTVAYSGITGIKIPASVESIGDRAFQKMTNLTSVSFGEGSALTTIGASAFYECKNLSSIDIPQGVTTIGNYAFYNCQNLESVVIPDNVTSVGSYLFRNCTGLESAVIGKSIAQLEGTFIYCSNLESLIIRSNAVTTFSRYTFYDCSKLTSITIPCNFDKAKFTSDSSYINVTDVGDTFTVQGTSASGTFTYTHNYSEPVWNWDDIEHPTYSTSCADCGDEKAGEADSVTVTHNNPDGAVPGCTEAKASVVIDGETYESTHIAGALEITNYAQLKTFASRVNGGETDLSAKLMNDIDASASETDVWTHIGYCEHDETGKITFDAAFIGTFDGDGHVITGLTCNDSSAEYAGLFGYVDAKSDTAKGTVKNVGLEGGSINGGSYAGGVVGYNNGGSVQSCYNTGDVSGSDYVGGVVGYNNGGTVQSCYNTGDVSGSDYVGGVVGYNNGGTVTNCYNTGDVSGSDYVGGVAGDSGSPDGIKKVDNCYYDKSVCGNIGAVSGADDASNVKGLTTAQMTGANALDNMVFEFGDGEVSPWQIKANGADVSGKYFLFYPHLKGFAYDLTAASEDWPAKVEVSATWSGKNSYTYNGQAQMPSVTSVTIGDTSVPEGTSVTYFKNAYSGENAWEWNEILGSPTEPGKYKMEISSGDEELGTKYFIILAPVTDYTVRYYENTGYGWSTESVDPIDAGDYKAVITFSETGSAAGHAPIEKVFVIDPASVTLTANSGTENYDGTEKTVSGFTSNVEGLTFDGVTASGSGTDAGDYDVTFSGVTINETRDATGNYIVTGTGNGTLTINPASVTLTANSGTENYDGTEKTVSGFTSIVEGLTFDGVNASG
ncbi:MAG: leucine-rich repeat domain-containing protein, partial [Clostridia bacterium]|nr:leucine-rich repeat domain-containing protein [Clostridia bacterium]